MNESTTGADRTGSNTPRSAQNPMDKVINTHKHCFLWWTRCVNTRTLGKRQRVSFFGRQHLTAARCTVVSFHFRPKSRPFWHYLLFLCRQYSPKPMLLWRQAATERTLHTWISGHSTGYSYQVDGQCQATTAQLVGERANGI